MPSVLVVDDTPSIRALVARLLERLGFEVAEARDGVEGLATLAECRFDLIVLDVMMPNMDGPAMLAKVREGGDSTPVIMLTAESHRPTIASAMRAGIADYVIKPLEPDELCRKVVAVIQRTTGARVAPVTTPGCPAPAGLFAGPTRPERRQFVDVLVVDDMENVAKRLRGMLPKHVSMNAVTCAQSAVKSAGEKSYRVMLVDIDIPGVDSAALAQQMRQLQPQAVMGALAMRTSGARQGQTLREQGFEIVLCKPFAQQEVDDLLLPRLVTREILTRAENVLKLEPFTGKGDECERHFGKLLGLFPAALKDVACASYGEVIVDFGCVPDQPDLVARLLAWTAVQARELGLAVVAIGSGETSEALARFEETKTIPCFRTAQEARAAGALPAP